MAGLNTDADSAIAAVIVEGGDVVPSRFREIQYLRNGRVLMVYKPAVDHPVHFGIGTADFEAGPGRFPPGRMP